MVAAWSLANVIHLNHLGGNMGATKHCGCYYLSRDIPGHRKGACLGAGLWQVLWYMGQEPGFGFSYFG